MTASTPKPDTTQDDSIGRLAELIAGDPMARLDADMTHVLEQLAALGARPLENIAPQTARRQPRAAQAIDAILARQGRERPDDGVAVEDRTIPGAAGALAARLYRPAGLLGQGNPLVLYFHGGGFVTGDLDSHDASARALARRTGAIVVSVDYALAPEQQFPAAHDDAWAAWLWLNENAGAIGGDARRIAVAGEDAGATLAAHIAITARDGGKTPPLHQLLIHPIAGTDMSTPSYGEALRARPIGLAAMRWRFRHVFETAADVADPRINLAGRTDLAGVAPATIVLADIDPLRSEGQALADRFAAAGIQVNCWTYEGVTQGFFGLGLVVTKSLFAQSDAADALSKSFSTRQLR